MSSTLDADKVKPQIFESWFENWLKIMKSELKELDTCVLQNSAIPSFKADYLYSPQRRRLSVDVTINLTSMKHSLTKTKTGNNFQEDQSIHVYMLTYSVKNYIYTDNQEQQVTFDKDKDKDFKYNFHYLPAPAHSIISAS